MRSVNRPSSVGTLGKLKEFTVFSCVITEFKVVELVGPEHRTPVMQYAATSMHVVTFTEQIPAC